MVQPGLVPPVHPQRKRRHIAVGDAVRTRRGDQRIIGQPGLVDGRRFLDASNNRAPDNDRRHRIRFRRRHRSEGPGSRRAVARCGFQRHRAEPISGSEPRTRWREPRLRRCSELDGCQHLGTSLIDACSEDHRQHQHPHPGSVPRRGARRSSPFAERRRHRPRGHEQRRGLHRTLANQPQHRCGCHVDLIVVVDHSQHNDRVQRNRRRHRCRSRPRSQRHAQPELHLEE